MKTRVEQLVALAPDAPAERSAASRPGHCFDCPSMRRNLLCSLIGEDSSCCQMESIAIEPLESIPLRWYGRYSLGFVRRGTFIRQVTDSQGRAAAVDVVGPGAAFYIDERLADEAHGTMSGGYALSRTLICVSTQNSIERALEGGGQSALDLYRLSREAMTRMERLADARSRPLVASRVAALLTTLLDTHSPASVGQSLIPPDFRQRDMAALLSTRHESVCRVLRDFSRRGLIEQSDAGTRVVERRALDAI